MFFPTVQGKTRQSKTSSAIFMRNKRTKRSTDTLAGDLTVEAKVVQRPRHHHQIDTLERDGDLPMSMLKNSQTPFVMRG